MCVSLCVDIFLDIVQTENKVSLPENGATFYCLRNNTLNINVCEVEIRAITILDF